MTTTASSGVASPAPLAPPLSEASSGLSLEEASLLGAGTLARHAREEAALLPARALSARLQAAAPAAFFKRASRLLESLQRPSWVRRLLGLGDSAPARLKRFQRLAPRLQELGRECRELEREAAATKQVAGVALARALEAAPEVAALLASCLKLQEGAQGAVLAALQERSLVLSQALVVREQAAQAATLLFQQCEGVLTALASLQQVGEAAARAAAVVGAHSAGEALAVAEAAGRLSGELEAAALLLTPAGYHVPAGAPAHSSERSL